MKKIALIVAAGSGSRMNSHTPKQFMLINHKPVLYYTIQAFLRAFKDIEFILVLPEDGMALGQEIIDGFFDRSQFRLCIGGRTRFHSVQNGLSLINPEEDAIIFVHDGVRCLVSEQLIQNCYYQASALSNAVPVVPCTDSLRQLDDDASTIVDRNVMRAVQTPQTFHSKILLPAFQIDYKDQFTDEASVVEAFGIKIHLIDGEAENIKITTPKDFEYARMLLSQQT